MQHGIIPWERAGMDAASVAAASQALLHMSNMLIQRQPWSAHNAGLDDFRNNEAAAVADRS